MDSISQWLLFFSKSLAGALALNGAVVALAYLIVWRLLKARLQGRRISEKPRVDRAQIRRELRNAVFTLAVGAAFSSVMMWLGAHGHSKVYLRFGDHHPAWGIAGFFLFLLIDDAWFYWMHRLLHHPRIFRRVHLEHHKSIDVNPFTSLSFHALEPALLTAWIVPASLLIPTYAPALMLLQLWGLLDNVKSHLGYEFYPAWWNRGPLRFLTSSTHHHMHHRKFRGNYGVHFRFWDRLMRTEFADYDETYDSVQKRRRAA